MAVMVSVATPLAFGAGVYVSVPLAAMAGWTQWTSLGTTDFAGRQVLITLDEDVRGRQGERARGWVRIGSRPCGSSALCDAGNTGVRPGRHSWLEARLGSGDDAFPSVSPRPIAPDLIMRAWKAPRRSDARAVPRPCEPVLRQGSYQGEQDNDPTDSTDCRVTSMERRERSG